jgi:hypothetical protein
MGRRLWSPLWSLLWLDLRGADWLVAYRRCGCLAGAVVATADAETLLGFAADCYREGLRVEPHRGYVQAAPCPVHARPAEDVRYAAPARTAFEQCPGCGVLIRGAHTCMPLLLAASRPQR